MYRAIDVMGFAGGFTLGAVQAGFNLVGKRELKGGFGVKNCEANRHLLGNNWRAEAGDAKAWTVPEGGANLVFGNPPCSGFSVMSSKDFRGADSKINACMWSFAEYVARVKPQIAIFESVQQARTKPDGHDLMKRLRARVEELTGDMWDLYHVRHNAIEVGGPSQRRRYFWVISRIPFGIEPDILPRKPILNEVIGDLSGLALTWDSQSYRSPATWWSESRRSETGAVDGHIGVHTPLTDRVLDLKNEVGWYAGESIADVARRCWETHGKLPASFARTEQKIVKNDFRMGFTTPVRWDGTRAGRVITGGSLVMVLHPQEDRMLTHREAARLLGFPDDWLIKPLRGVSGLQMTWGKGITVDCGRWIAGWAKNALDENPGQFKGDLIGEREWDIDVTHGTPRRLVKSTIVRRTATIRRNTVTDPNAPQVPTDGTEETAEATETRSTRGRGRPDETIKRDEVALKVLEAAGTTGLTRDELAAEMTKSIAADAAEGAEAIEITSSQAYLSIYRLNRDGKLGKTRRDGKQIWLTADHAVALEAEQAAAQPAPTEAASAEGEPVAPVE